jgi:hypothetical protein
MVQDDLMRDPKAEIPPWIRAMFIMEERWDELEEQFREGRDAMKLAESWGLVGRHISRLCPRGIDCLSSAQETPGVELKAGRDDGSRNQSIYQQIRKKGAAAVQLLTWAVAGAGSSPLCAEAPAAAAERLNIICV